MHLGGILVDDKFKAILKAIKWPITYGIISVTIRDGVPVVVKVEQTTKLD